MDILEELRSLLGQQFGISENTIDLSTSIDSLDMDSLELVDLIMALEQTFNIEIDDEKIAQAKTIDDIVRFIESARLEG